MPMYQYYINDITTFFQTLYYVFIDICNAECVQIGFLFGILGILFTIPCIIWKQRVIQTVKKNYPKETIYFKDMDIILTVLSQFILFFSFGTIIMFLYLNPSIEKIFILTQQNKIYFILIFIILEIFLITSLFDIYVITNKHIILRNKFSRYMFFNDKNYCQNIDISLSEIKNLEKYSTYLRYGTEIEIIDIYLNNDLKVGFYPNSNHKVYNKLISLIEKNKKENGEEK